MIDAKQSQTQYEEEDLEILRQHYEEVRTAAERIRQWIEASGPIKTVRVSSAQAKQYQYWSAVRYRIVWSARHQWPVNVPVERASSDRRAHSLAVEDALALAEREGRIHLQAIGRLSHEDVIRIADELSRC